MKFNGSIRKKKPTQNSILKQPYENVQGKKVKAEIS